MGGEEIFIEEVCACGKASLDGLKRSYRTAWTAISIALQRDWCHNGCRKNECFAPGATQLTYEHDALHGETTPRACEVDHEYDEKRKTNQGERPDAERTRDAHSTPLCPVINRSSIAIIPRLCSPLLCNRDPSAGCMWMRHRFVRTALRRTPPFQGGYPHRSTLCHDIQEIKCQPEPREIQPTPPYRLLDLSNSAHKTLHHRQSSQT